MPQKIDECVKSVMESGKTESEAWAICKAKFQDSAPIHRQFADIATFSASERTAVSVRDGVLEYLGSEIGLEPADKIFTVYRSPATIANAAWAMQGIPLTDEHVSLDEPAPDGGGRVEMSQVIDQVDESTYSRLAVRNKLSVSDQLSPTLEQKRQLSLGYGADLIPHDRWDFEQVEIKPHHLAVVPAGRCGKLCSFLDRKPDLSQKEPEQMDKLHKAFKDAEGSVNLEQIVEIATSLPEAIRKVPVDRLQELMPAMQEIMSYAKEQGALPEEEAPTDEGMGDEGMKEGEEEDEKKFSDADFKDALEKEKQKFADAEVKRYAQVVNKARNFLDAEYDFTGKTANQVMRDALATQSSDQFEDSELPVAFKMLRKQNTDYTQFGDTKPEGGLAARIKAEIGEE
jgi:hypothetical protein